MTSVNFGRKESAVDEGATSETPGVDHRITVWTGKLIWKWSDEGETDSSMIFIAT